MEIELINKNALFNLALLCRCIADAMRDFLGFPVVKMSWKTDHALLKGEFVIKKLVEGALLVESKNTHLPVSMAEPGGSSFSTSFIDPSVDGMAFYAFFLENENKKENSVFKGKTHSMCFWEILEIIKNRNSTFTEENKNRIIYLFDSLSTAMSNGILTLGIKNLERFL